MSCKGSQGNSPKVQFFSLHAISVVSFGEDTTGSTTKEALSFIIIGHYLTVSKWKAEFRPSTASINLGLSS